MGTVEENHAKWTAWDWDERGETAWSRTWGGTELLWHGAIMPRIQAFVPTGTILEIAPGSGRFTRYLKDLSGRLIVVDLVERCIEICKSRFADSTNIEYHTNNGTSLNMVDDASVDFAFSFDSLVHAEIDVVEAYIEQMARVLSNDGVFFLHHSNLGALQVNLVREDHWRSRSTTAELVEKCCIDSGLSCVAQELVNWGGDDLIDGFSVIAKKGSKWDRPMVKTENKNFMNQAVDLSKLASLYLFR